MPWTHGVGQDVPRHFGNDVLERFHLEVPIPSKTLSCLRDAPMSCSARAPLRRSYLIPLRTHPDVALFIGRGDPRWTASRSAAGSCERSHKPRYESRAD